MSTARLCIACGDSLEGMSMRAKYCSNACYKWIANGHTEMRVKSRACEWCSLQFSGRLATALYCSARCKSQASEARRERDDQARYRKERDKRIAYAKRYAKEKPHVGQATKRRRRAALADAGVYQFTGAAWKKLCNQHQGKCAYCRQVRSLTMDHVVPVSRGGTHSAGNILPACLSCNASKNARTLMEWRMKRGEVMPHPLEA